MSRKASSLTWLCPVLPTWPFTAVVWTSYTESLGTKNSSQLTTSVESRMLHSEEINSTNNHISLEQDPKLCLRRGIPTFREEFSLIETLIMGVTLTEGTHTHT